MATEAGPVTVAVCGAEGPVGSRLARRLAEDPGALPRVLDPAQVDVDALAGVGALVLLGAPTGADLDGSGGSGLDVGPLGRVLALAGEAGVGTVVVLSSAMAYGAWTNNPVPLTEEAALRPCPGAGDAAARAELERVALGWREDHPGATVALLRPTVVSDPERTGWFDRSPWAGRRPRVRRGDAPRQLLDVDDLVSAVDLAWRQRLDGPFNVAPDGWVGPDELNDLLGPFLPLPGPLERLGDRLPKGWPVGLAPYLHQPWVVANDRLRATGWVPAVSNEAAVVAAQRPRRWRSLSPRARQELSLGVGGAVLAAVVGAVALVVLRRRRRR